jgi:hypothetical protein
MFFISMKARVGARIDDTDAIQSFSLPVLGLKRLKGKHWLQQDPRCE